MADDMTAKVDALMAHLRQTVRRDVWGVGLTRVDGPEHLLVMASPAVEHLIPLEFDGVRVTVCAVEKAVAQ